ncbi:MAG: hypothetical protein OEY38_08265 [Gammaproteobacteria bacterium]|nr:hypothetical protein [Gammaproteobacteria bacterium]
MFKNLSPTHLFGQEKIRYQTSDDFGEIQVVDDKLLRTLYLGSRNKQSAMVRSHPNVLVLEYTQLVTSALLFQPNPKSILVLGLGGASLVKFFRRLNPCAEILAVELREKVVNIAHDFFYLPRNDSHLHLYCEDAFKFIEIHAQDLCNDILVVDLFSQNGPSKAATSTVFFNLCKQSLSKKGILCVNWWNNDTRNLKLIVSTLKQLFSGKLLYINSSKKPGNILIFAFNDHSIFEPGLSDKMWFTDLEHQTGINYTHLVRRFRQC